MLRVLIFGTLLIAAPPCANSSDTYRFNDWTVTAAPSQSVPGFAANPPLCSMELADGDYKLFAYAWVDSEPRINLEIRRSKGSWRWSERWDWSNISEWYGTPLTVELDKERFTVGFKKDAAYDSRTVLEPTVEGAADWNKTDDIDTKLDERIKATMRQNSALSKALLGRIAESASLRISQNKNEIAKFSTKGAKDAYGFFNKCVGSGGRL